MPDGSIPLLIAIIALIIMSGFFSATETAYTSLNTIKLKSLAQKDSRFIVINQENGGVSKARNTGLRMVTGEYIMFLDSDDYLECYACEEALNSILKNNVDICIFGYTIRQLSESQVY